MIGYVVLGTNDLARAASFYDELLAEMGVSRMMEFGERGYAWAAAIEAVSKTLVVAPAALLSQAKAPRASCGHST